MLRFQIWDFQESRMLRAFGVEADALAAVRLALHEQEIGIVNRLGLVDKGGPGEYLTYPLEGAALLAKAFGLKEGES